MGNVLSLPLRQIMESGDIKKRANENDGAFTGGSGR
jgi:hypothetical protein